MTALWEKTQTYFGKTYLYHKPQRIPRDKTTKQISNSQKKKKNQYLDSNKYHKWESVRRHTADTDLQRFHILESSVMEYKIIIFNMPNKRKQKDENMNRG